MNKVINFFKNADKLRSEIEVYLVNFASGIIPWFAALIPAYFAFVHVKDILNVPGWLAFVFAGVIEVLGFASVSTSLEFWNFRQRYKDATTKGSVHWVVPVFSFSMYLIAIVLVNGLLSFIDRVDIALLYNSVTTNNTEAIVTQLAMPIVISVSIFLLSLMTIPGAVIVASRTAQERFLREKGLMGREKDKTPLESGRKRLEVKSEPVPVVEKSELTKNEKRFLDALRKDRGALKNITELAESLGLSRTTVHKYKNDLKRRGYFKILPIGTVHDIVD